MSNARELRRDEVARQVSGSERGAAVMRTSNAITLGFLTGVIFAVILDSGVKLYVTARNLETEVADLKTYAAWCRLRSCSITLADWQALRDANLLNGETP